MISIENEFKKAESIIEISEKLVQKGLLIDLRALERIVYNLHTVIAKDTSKYSGFLGKMDDINLSINNLSKKLIKKG